MAARLAAASTAASANQGSQIFARGIPPSSVISPLGIPTSVSLRADRVPVPRATSRGTHGNARRAAAMAQAKVAAAAEATVEPLSAGSPAPALFDGTTRLYHYKACPFAQRVVIAVNYKSLDFIERVEISLRSKPEWYTEKVYPPGKVPALEHDGKVVGESLDLLLLLDDWFGDKGPRIVPQDITLASEASTLVAACGDIVMAGYSCLSQHYQTGGEAEVEASMGAHLDSLEKSLAQHQSKGLFFLGNFSYVDIAYLPFLERFRIAFDHFCGTDITKGRPNLGRWFEAAATMQVYTDTCMERDAIITTYQQMLDNKYFERAGVANTKSAAAESSST
ncbi:hypothetical protein CLOM_g18986 [Closterium sp. NIES-68]|nr:hypothetical protein CLOM_g18986 [Closterium sp. NIES-68]GJP66174.1 hypothetical protein CLOP_g23079 [Closterium sp. NIES-67]